MISGALPGLVYQSVPGFEDHLERELLFADAAGAVGASDAAGLACSAGVGRGPGSGEVGESLPALSGPALPSNTNTGPQTWGPFFYTGRIPGAPVFWQLNTWLNPVQIEFDSINEAARALREIQRNWAPLLFTQFRRGSLIASKLPPVSQKPRPFPWLLPEAPMGAWTLLDERVMIASSRCSSPFPAGAIEFAEDREGPPSRAYLKLWESLTRLRETPRPGDKCLDAGASPGGWTWALSRLGAKVIAVDRAPLDERTAAMPGVSFIRHDAFTLKPEEIGPVDWLFCDVICYPPRLYDWIEKWLASGLCRNFVCTIKMQGGAGGGKEAPDFDTPRRFAAIPGSRVIHLYHNKHELTWMKTKTSSGG